MSLIYTNEILIKDKKHYTTTNFIKKYDEFYVVFSDKLVKLESSKGVDIFNNNTKTNVDIKIKCVSNKMMVDYVLPSTINLYDLKLILCYLLKIHYDNIELENNVLNKNIQNEIYEKDVILGNSKLHFVINDLPREKNNSYELMFRKEVNDQLKFISKLSKNKVNIYPFYTEIKYGLYLNKSKNDVSINLPKLFNIHETNEIFPKIFIHSDTIDEYKNTINSYIKTNYPTIRPLAEIDAYKNSVIFIYNKYINPSETVRLFQISVFENGIIEMSFKNVSQTYEFDELNEIILNWLNSKAKTFLKKLFIEECVYDLEFSIDKFNYSLISLNCVFDIETKYNIKQIEKINEILGFNNAYSTKSSFRCYGLQQVNIGSMLLMNIVENTKTNFSTTTKQFYFDSSIQVNINDKHKLTMTLNNICSYDYLMFLTELLTRYIEYNSVNKIIKKDESKAILNNLQNVDVKTKIKLLKDADPLTFGNRYVDNDLRDYSQLVQNNEQRPSLITFTEYKILKKIKPDSVLNIENQTTKQRLYLACPFDELPVINYHHYDKQKCIIKCTTKYNNAVQYEYCDKQLNGIDNNKVSEIKHTSNTITAFNPIIDENRKCLVPDELFDLFPNHVLHKQSSQEIPYKYIKAKYNKSPFIIERDNIKNLYYIKTDYNKLNSPYILVLTIHNTRNWFLFNDVLTNEILEFDDSTENEFIKQIIKVSHYKNNISVFIDFFNDITGDKINNELTLKEFQQKTKDYCKLISDFTETIIIGFVYKNTVYFSPKVYNTGVNVISFNDTQNLLTTEKYKYPSFKEFNVEKITKLYKDYKTRKFYALEYNNIRMLIKPSEIMDKRAPIEIVDITSFILELTTFNYETLSKQNENIEIINYNNLMIEYLCLVMFGKITEENFNKVIKKFASTKNEFKYINSYVSWRDSKIKLNKDFIINFNNSEYILYDKVIKEIELKYNKENEYFYKAGIY